MRSVRLQVQEGRSDQGVQVQVRHLQWGPA